MSDGNRDHSKPGESWDKERIAAILFEGGAIATDLRKDLRFELKSDSSLVTAADREIEALFAARFDRPDRGSFLIGEETVTQKGEDYLARALRGTAYVVDPIDGTSPYAHRLPNWGISLGLMVNGKLTDGAVLLPDLRLLVMSDGPRVLEAAREEGSKEWFWRELSVPPVETGPSGIVVITQDIVKSGKVDLKNPVLAFGAAVIALVGILTGRVLAYVGSLRLWDVAGSLPLLHRLNFHVSQLRGSPGNRLGLAVGPENYFLDPNDSFRWGVRGGVLICPPSEEDWIRKAFRV